MTFLRKSDFQFVCLFNSMYFRGFLSVYTKNRDWNIEKKLLKTYSLKKTSKVPFYKSENQLLVRQAGVFSLWNDHCNRMFQNT